VQYSARYVVLFAIAVCAVCSVFVSSAAVFLKERQEANEALDLQTKVLGVAGLMSQGEDIDDAEVRRRFDKSIETHIVDLSTGNLADEIDPQEFDQHKAAKDPEHSSLAPPNAAKVIRVPNHAKIFHVVSAEGTVEKLILPIEGTGLWGMLYGYLALDPDTRTIAGITFYKHTETPGLGGEVDNPRWKDLWPGRKAFDESWQPAIRVVKGRAGTPEDDPYRVDGLSGATITSRGVSNLLAFWLGDAGFGPYLANYRNQRGI